MSMRPKAVRVAVLSAAFLLFAALVGTTSFAQQSQSAATSSAADFVGTWHWMFQGKPFVTMVLRQEGDRFAGSITHSAIDMGDDGKITNATGAEGSSPITRAVLQDGALHIVTKEGDEEIEVVFTLTSPKSGELRFAGEGAPANAEAIKVEKLWSEPPVQP